jgi:hypothetical protein
VSEWKEEEKIICDCGKRKARLVYACNVCVPTQYFPKGVKRAKEFTKFLKKKSNSM